MAPPAPGSIQIVQPIVGPGGDIQQIPIQLTNQQLSMIRGHLTGTQAQPLVIQTAPIQPQNIIAGQPAQSGSGQPQQQGQQQ